MNDASILVVEDDGLIALRSQELLTKSGYTVSDLFASGEEVLEYLESAILPDLILMDIGLAGTMNGIETARMVREKYDIPIIFLSAYSNDQRIAEAKDVSPYGYIIKPFVEHQLLGCIHDALAR
jgi:two-component system, response regulator PdtaR